MEFSRAALLTSYALPTSKVPINALPAISRDVDLVKVTRDAVHILATPNDYYNLCSEYGIKT